MSIVVPKDTENTGKGPKEGSIDFAVAQLLKEPEQSATPEEEPEATEEETEEVSEVEEVEEAESDEYEEVDGEEEAEEGEETSEEDSDEDEEQDSASEYYTVKVNGEELEVTLDELQSGYQRQKDYTRKTQELAEHRKEMESKLKQFDQTYTDFMDKAQIADNILQRDMKKFENVDWETLKETDPNAYVQKKLEIQDIQEKQRELRAEAQRIYEFNQQRAQEEMKRHVEAESKKLMDMYPEWKNPEKATADKLAIFEYAKGQGYHEQELASVINARDLAILDKARKYDELQKNKKSIVKKKTRPAIRKVVKPKGTEAKVTSKTRKIKETHGRLRKSGSLRDAAELMYELRSSNKIRK